MCRRNSLPPRRVKAVRDPMPHRARRARQRRRRPSLLAHRPRRNRPLRPPNDLLHDRVAGEPYGHGLEESQWWYSSHGRRASREHSRLVSLYTNYRLPKLIPKRSHPPQEKAFKRVRLLRQRRRPMRPILLHICTATKRTTPLPPRYPTNQLCKDRRLAPAMCSP